MVDLHIHTTRSDGQYTPAEVAALAHRAGIEIMAITDHDSVAGVAEGRSAAEALGIGFVSGIEISVRGNRELHILGYRIDERDAALESMCIEFARLRGVRQQRIIDYLATHGVIISPAQVRALAGDAAVGRPHFARAMTELGYVSSPREAFDKYLGTPEFDAVERPKPTPQHGIDVIRRAGGIAVLAHPKLLKLDDTALDSLVKTLVSSGLGGIECYYGTHSEYETARYLTLAEKYGLLVTGGSDFHGEAVKPDVALGAGCGSLNIKPSDIAAALSRFGVAFT